MSKHNLKHSTLVPIDFSENSLKALSHAAHISKIMDDDNQEITLLHVVESTTLQTITDQTHYDADNETGKLVNTIKEKLQELINKYEKELNAEIRYLIRSGKPYHVIVETADELEADSIVMGTRGAANFREFIGSNAAKVVQSAHCPVVVINEKAVADGYKHIVMPLDFSGESRQTVGYAAKIAKVFDSTIHIVSEAEEDEFLKADVQSNIRNVENYFKEHQVKFETELISEDVDEEAKVALKYAEQKGADLILLMTQKDTGIGDAIFGSYAQRIVTRSKIPVMCIHPRQDLEAVWKTSSPGLGV